MDVKKKYKLFEPQDGWYPTLELRMVANSYGYPTCQQLWRKGDEEHWRNFPVVPDEATIAEEIHLTGA